MPLARQARAIAMRRFASVTSGKERRIGVAVFAWWQRRQERSEEIVRQVQIAIALVLLGVGSDANRQALLVEVADDGRLKLGDARPALVEDEKRQDVARSDEPQHALDVLGRRRWQMRLPFARELDTLVAGDVRRDAVEVERLRERCSRLPERLALVACGRERGDQVGDVGDSEFVDTTRAQLRLRFEDARER